MYIIGYMLSQKVIDMYSKFIIYLISYLCFQLQVFIIQN